MARMSIDDKFLRDPRVTQLALDLGVSRWEAMGRLLAVFAVCYDLERDIITPAQVDLAADRPGLADALFAVDLAVTTRRGLRIRGVKKRIEYLTPKREAGRQGGIKSGESRRNSAKQKRTNREATVNLPDPVPDPVVVPDVVLVPDPVPETPTPIAVAPLPAQSFAAKDLARHRALGDLAEAIWTRLSTLRIQHAAKLGLEGTLPFPAITPGSVPRAFHELRARLREEGDNARAVADHVIRVLDEQARTTKSIEWLSEKAFLERPWSKARETPIGKRKPAAAAPSSPPVIVLTDDERAGAADVLAAFLGTQQPAKAAT